MILLEKVVLLRESRAVGQRGPYLSVCEEKTLKRRSSIYPGLALVAALFIVNISAVSAAVLPDFSALVEKNAPAVVNISTTSKPVGHPGLPHGFSVPDLPDDSPLNDFFKKFFEQQPGQPAPPGAHSLGSGFIISTDGYILTNSHVVKDADEIIVSLQDRNEYQAELIGMDARADVAILKIDAKNLPFVKPGNMDEVKVGQWVLAIGSPFGFRESATSGIVSALNRALPSDTYVPFIQTDAAVNPGNSGGPLFNLKGEVIGINSQIFSRSGGYQGVSFAIPIDVALRVMEQLKTKGYVTRGWLGVLIQEIDHDLADSFGMRKPEGALVAQITEDSPAAAAGIRVGDIIVEYDNKKVVSSSMLPPMVGRTPVNSTVPVVVLRNGNPITLKVTIGELEREDAEKVAKAPVNKARNKLNLKVGELSPEEREKLAGDDRGVAVRLVGEGPAAIAGIRPKDIVLSINNQDVTSAAQFESIVSNLPVGKAVPILIQREGRALFLAIKIPSK